MSDDFPAHNYNRCSWMWTHYDPPFGVWTHPDWNAAGVPPLHGYVGDCLS
jgi:hypothetical protein